MRNANKKATCDMAANEDLRREESAMEFGRAVKI